MTEGNEGEGKTRRREAWVVSFAKGVGSFEERKTGNEHRIRSMEMYKKGKIEKRELLL
jgi:hypothetical protein